MLLERLVANLLDNAERCNIAGGTVTISTTACGAPSPQRQSPPDDVRAIRGGSHSLPGSDDTSAIRDVSAVPVRSYSWIR
jgi:hypothetical protein